MFGENVSAILEGFSFKTVELMMARFVTFLPTDAKDNLTSSTATIKTVVGRVNAKDFSCSFSFLMWLRIRVFSWLFLVSKIGPRVREEQLEMCS